MKHLLTALLIAIAVSGCINSGNKETTVMPDEYFTDTLSVHSGDHHYLLKCKRLK